MSIGVKTFHGERLREARLSRGLFKNALGDLIGVTGTAITRYEDGVDRPPADRLEAIARQLNFPIEFFLSAAWPEQIELVHWRSQASESKSAREMTEQRMRWLCEIYAYLGSEVDFGFSPLPDFDVPADVHFITGQMIERVAMEVRQAWGLRSEPIPDMILALENSGIPVTTINFSSEKQDGFCFKSNLLDKVFVGINIENASCSRARLDAAHELGHYILHKNVSVAQARHPTTHKIMEKQAFRFAGALLFPRDAFLEEVGSVSLDYFCALKRRWGMAISAMVVRAGDLGLIDAEEIGILFRSMTKRRWRGIRREPFDTEMKMERPRMLRRGFEAMFNSGIFSKAAIASALPHPPREIEDIASLEPGSLSQSSSPQMPVSIRQANHGVVDLESGNVLQFPRRQN
ncbi:helix-turn-helix domain-containing protein [Mesorhizobium kowhaii]|uniref:helix-turn-helix domain-containing protein n=1 Tax=Mesorhizobium kowhaii TaxID=1300272 RepID=UPI0035EE7A55